MLKRILALLLCLLPLSAASAAELTDEDFAFWYDQMAYLVEEIGTRTVGNPEERDAYDYIYSLFEELGFSEDDGTLWESYSIAEEWTVEESISLVAVKPAINPDPSIITICAHYDSLSPGARDNASGAAAMLTLCRLFTQYDPFPDVELRFIAFSAEDTGHQGSMTYCAELTSDERHRTIAVFNLDILVAGYEEPTQVLSLDTVGMRTPNGYQNGTPDDPKVNLAAQAMLDAMSLSPAFPPDEEEQTWCGVRHMAMSDHESFHYYGMDAVNVCFRGTTASGGNWPVLMHSESDLLDNLNLPRTRDALNAVYTAVLGVIGE